MKENNVSNCGVLVLPANTGGLSSDIHITMKRKAPGLDEILSYTSPLLLPEIFVASLSR